MHHLRVVVAAMVGALVGALLGYTLRGPGDGPAKPATRDRDGAAQRAASDPARDRASADPSDGEDESLDPMAELEPPDEVALVSPSFDRAASRERTLVTSDHDGDDATVMPTIEPASPTPGTELTRAAVPLAPTLAPMAPARPLLALGGGDATLLVPGVPAHHDRHDRLRPEPRDDDDEAAPTAPFAPSAPLPACDRRGGATPPTPFETCLSTTLGEPVWRGTLGAADPAGILVPAAEACDYLLVVSGVFAYSATGRQDALRRWHDPLVYDFEPFCTACGVDELEALIAFVIDDRPRRPLAECPLSNAYVYHVTPDDGAMHVAINDYSVTFARPQYDDNAGGLELALYTVPAEHELLARYVDETEAFGVPLGASLGVQHLGFTPGSTPILMLLSFPDLATFSREVSWPTRADRRYLLDVRGFYTAQPGVEADALFKWPPLTMSDWPFIIEGCNHVLVGTDAYAHRSAYDLSGCGPTLVVRATHERPAGVIAVELFER